MKRKTYRVTASNGVTNVKFAYNAALRRGEQLLRAEAIRQNLTGCWDKTDGGLTRENYDIVRGHRVWRHRGTGTEFRIDIELLGEEG